MIHVQCTGDLRGMAFAVPTEGSPADGSGAHEASLASWSLGPDCCALPVMSFAVVRLTALVAGSAAPTHAVYSVIDGYGSGVCVCVCVCLCGVRHEIRALQLLTHSSFDQSLARRIDALCFEWRRTCRDIPARSA
jgi:hypothetical protein